VQRTVYLLEYLCYELSFRVIISKVFYLDVVLFYCKDFLVFTLGFTLNVTFSLLPVQLILCWCFKFHFNIVKSQNSSQNFPPINSQTKTE